MITAVAFALSTQFFTVRTVIPFFDEYEDFRMSVEVPYAFGKWKLREYGSPDPNDGKIPLSIVFTRSDVPYRGGDSSEILLSFNSKSPHSPSDRMDLFMDTDPDFEYKSKWKTKGWTIRVGFFVNTDRKRSIGWFLAQGKFVDLRAFSFSSGANDKELAKELTDSFHQMAEAVLPNSNVKQDNWKKISSSFHVIP